MKIDSLLYCRETVGVTAVYDFDGTYCLPTIASTALESHQITTASGMLWDAPSTLAYVAMTTQSFDTQSFACCVNCFLLPEEWEVVALISPDHQLRMLILV